MVSFTVYSYFHRAPCVNRVKNLPYVSNVIEISYDFPLWLLEIYLHTSKGTKSFLEC